MYEELMGLGALDMESIKKESMSLAVTGVSAVAGAAVAKLVVKNLPKAWASMNAPAWINEWLVPAVPLVAGAAIGIYGRSLFSEMEAPAKRAMVDGLAVGMAAYSLASYVAKWSAAAEYVPFQLAGLGAQDFSVQAYLHGAPTAIERLNGAPTSIERLNGAPTGIEPLNGYTTLASTLM